MSTTNYLASNLTNRYDMVVATTAQAINNQMLKYLTTLNKAQPIEIWYQQTERRGPLKDMTPINLGSKKLFDFTENDDVPETLISNHFRFAVRARFGIPDGLKEEYKQVIRFKEGSNRVLYNLFFSSFEIIERKIDSEGAYFNKVTQLNNAPIIFQMEVDLNFEDKDPESKFYKDLSESDKARLNNLHTRTMFSVKQLYLDLNTAQLQNKPEIAGLDKEGEVLKQVTSAKFINASWKSFFGSSAVVLGYATTTKERTDRSSIKPKELNFMISPYRDGNGRTINKPELFTLNYLMKFEEGSLYPNHDIPWNWVEENESKYVDGAMAIRRQEFAEFLAASLEPHLPNLCIKPVITSFNSGTFKWSASSRFDRDSNPGSINYTPIGVAWVDKWNIPHYLPADNVLRFQYTEGAKKHIKHKALGVFDSLSADAHYKLWSYADMSVCLSNDQIIIDVWGSMQVDFDPGDAFDTGNVEGRVGSYRSQIILQIEVTSNGRLQVKQLGDYSKPSTQGTDFDKGIMAGVDGSSSFIGKIADRYKDCTNWAGSFANKVESYLNNSGNNWVFPGGQTFGFSDARFSECQDLVTHIYYKEFGLRQQPNVLEEAEQAIKSNIKKVKDWADNISFEL